MKTRLSPSFAALVLMGASLVGWQHAFAQTQSWVDCPPHRVAYQAVQRTPQYDLRRPEVVSGAQVSLFGNFLGSQPGIVLFNLNGTSSKCKVIDWKEQSVTAQLPHLGLREPQNVELQIVLPDGRIAKTFRVLLVMPADVVIHAENAPVPMPPGPAGAPAAYATP